MVTLRIGMITAILAIGSVAFLPNLPSPLALSLLLLPILARLFFKRLRWLIPLFVALFFGSVWAASYGYLGKLQQLPAPLEGVDLWVEGDVVGLPKETRRAQRFELEVLAVTSIKGEPIEQSMQRVRINWYQSGHYDESNLSHNANIRVQPGERWRLLLRLKRPHGFANPGGFDYQGWLFRQGIGATGYVRQHKDNQRLLLASNGRLLDQWRYGLLTRLSTLLGNDPQKGLFLALLMGESAGISTAQRQLLSATGTNHLFVISGLHVGFVALCAYLLFFNLSRWLLLGPPRVAAQQVGVCGALLVACLYAAIAGFSLPAQRALIMLVVMLLGRLFRRKIDVWHSYIVALLLVLLWDPLAVHSAGFWLSFGAVASLLYACSQRTGNEGLWWRWGRPQWVVFVAFFPVLLFFFQQVSLISPLANIVVIPLIGFIVVPLCLLIVLLESVPQLFDGILFDTLIMHLAMWASTGLHYVIKFLVFLAQIPASQWQHTVTLWELLLALAGALLLLAPIGLPARWLGLLCFCPLFMGNAELLRDGEFEMTVLDVGQGLAIAIQTKNHHLIYDVGARFSADFDASSAVILPYLRQRGVRRLDRVIISHGDNDHAGSLSVLLAGISVTEVMSGASKRLDEGIEGVGFRACQSGFFWQWDNVNFELMRADAQSWHKENNRSCVLKVSGLSLSVLIPGDIEKRAELSLQRQFGSRLQADVLLAPHHGSLTSSSEQFLAHVKPAVVIFSSGYRNRFGHPHELVLGRYRQRHIRVLNTAHEGAIVVSHRDDKNIPITASQRRKFKRYWF